MNESCKICLGKIKEEDLNDLASKIKLEFQSEDALSITENPIACNKCKDEIDETYQLYVENEGVRQIHPHLIKEEFIDDSIKSEVIVEDDSMLLNTDISLGTKDCIPVTILYCFHCNYGTNDKQNLTDHIFAHRFKCNRCNYTTPDNSMLESHQQMGCLQLDKLTTHTASELDKNDHKLVSTDLFECHDCRYKTNSKLTLELHVQLLCSKRQVPRYKRCKLCGYESKYLSYFKSHLEKVHSLEKPFKCTLCKFSTKYLYALKEHLRRHSGELNYKCDKCDYKTYSRSRFVTHKKIHSEKKPFKCKLCNFSSKHSSCLKVHLRKHSGESYNCDKCDFKTCYKYYLKNHKKVHSEEKPFKCSLCEFSSRRLSGLQLHIMRHSLKDNYYCDKCDYKTCSKENLKTHKVVHSG